MFFYEPDGQEASDASYFFPKNSELRLTKYIKERRLEDIKAFFEDIRRKNVSRASATPAALRALVDELHITVLKCVKSINELNTTRIHIEKMSSVALLDEIFDYYYAVFAALVNELQNREDTVGSEKLSATILQLITAISNL